MSECGRVGVWVWVRMCVVFFFKRRVLLCSSQMIDLDPVDNRQGDAVLSSRK